METQLKCALLLSLKEMALRRVAVLVGSGSDILASISKFRFFGCHHVEEWRETVGSKIKDKMLKLELPEPLTKQMIEIARPIGLQIRIWKDCQEDYLSNEYENISLPNSAKLCWTTAGLIDYRKTAEELVRCNALDRVQRYKLACINCLEDDIPLLWEELPVVFKKRFLRKGIPLPALEICWAYIIRGELSGLDYLWRTSDRSLSSFNQWAFEHSVENGSKTAAEYFFQKLTHEEREASLMRTTLAVLRDRFRIRSKYLFRFRCEKLSDVLCYLLSIMTPEQQMQTLKAHPIDVMLRFLDWPWPDLFLENADLFWTFLPPSGYSDLQRKMAYSLQNSYHYFPKLFQEFFMQSPVDFKKSLVHPDPEFNTITAHIFLYVFFDFDDSESIKVIFRNVDATDRMRLVFHPCVFERFYIEILKDGWHLVEVCLREATLSKEDWERLKEAFTGFLERNVRGQIEWENPKLKRFFEFLNEADASANKLKKGQKRNLENCCPE